MSALTVVYLTTTGHVLAALTRAAPPEGAEQVEAFVGANLPVRGIGTTPADFAFPANLLAAVTLGDSLPLAVIDPQAFQVVEDPQDKAHPKVTQFLVTTAPAATLTLDTTSGAKVKLTNVPPTTSLQAVVILQKVTTPAQAVTIPPPVTVTGDPNGTIVADKKEFAAGETWNFYAFVQGAPPSSLSQAL